MAELNCRITGIRFQDDGKPFAIVDTTGGIVQGEIAEDLVVGTILSLRGEYTTSPRYGRFFRVTKVLAINEAPEDTGKLWLTWRLPHIGPVRSAHLSETYRDRLPEFMEGPDVARVLSGMRGLTAKNIAEIQAAYAEYPNELRLALFLGHPNPERPTLGIKFRVFKLAIREYQTAAALNAQVEDDPFELMALDGVTFPAIDRLAWGLGLDAQDPRRLRGLAWSELDYMASKGDTLMHDADLIRSLRNEEIKHSVEEMREVLDASPHVVTVTGGAQLTQYARAETVIANRVQQLLEDEREQLELDLSVLPDWLDKSQRSAVVQLANAPFAILTGGPGTGKTTVLKQLLALLNQLKGNRVRLASPTGKAAKRMTEVTKIKATTVHRLLEWKPGGFTRDAKNPIEADVVIVDEASMLDTKVGAALFAAIGHGTRLILVGDVNQLPPVSAGQVLQDLMRSRVVPVVELTTTHRQGKDSWVIDAAPIVLAGGLPSLKKQSDFEFVECKSPAEIAEAVVKIYKQARAIGNEIGLQVLTPEHKNGAGVGLLNFTLQKSLNPNWTSQQPSKTAVVASGTQIFAGDKVLYTKNDSELGLVNGSIGVVIEANTKQYQAYAKVRFFGEVNPNEDTEDPEVFILENEQIAPLTLAYAMTVHKAQGSEWPQIVVIVEKSHWSMRRRLFYTAITRTSKNLSIVGDVDSVKRAARRNEDENRKTYLIERLTRG